MLSGIRNMTVLLARGGPVSALSKSGSFRMLCGLEGVKVVFSIAFPYELEQSAEVAE